MKEAVSNKESLLPQQQSLVLVVCHSADHLRMGMQTNTVDAEGVCLLRQARESRSVLLLPQQQPSFSLIVYILLILGNMNEQMRY